MIAAALLAAGVAFSAEPAPRGFKWRGVIEGYYGTPWSWEQRRRLVDWMPAHHFNLYAIDPKDDPEQRARWREPLSETTKRELKALNDRAMKNGVTLAWALSPGLDAAFGDPREVSAAVDKLASVCSLGIRELSLALDDTPANPGHIRFVNQVREGLLPRCPGVELTFVPAHYWGGAAPSRYLAEVAAKLDPAFLVAWTGTGILNRTVTKEDAARYKRAVKHDLILGDNYPVQDRLVDSGRLFLGPLTGRDPALAEENVGYLSNPSPLFETSLIPLATVGDYAWDPAHYDAAASWRKAVAGAAGPKGQRTLALLAGLCARSWLEPPANETDALEAAIGEFQKFGDAGPLRARLEAMARLSASALPPTLAAELSPWVVEAARQARGALDALDHRPARLPGPAVVADQALDRFLAGLSAHRRETSEPLTRLIARDGPPEEIRAGLDRLIEEGRAAGPSPELVPWSPTLAESALLARRALDGHPPSAARLWLAKLRAGPRVLPVLEARRLMEIYLSRKESSGAKGARLDRLQWWEEILFRWERFRHPRSFPSRLWEALDHEERLQPLFVELAQVPNAWKGIAAPEQSPWLDKLAGYAELGRLAAGDAGWKKSRERLASGNGLELAILLKLQLDALARGKKGPAPFPAEITDAL